ncbi:MAG: LssY C-terminal domain-containing protein, partial [Rickettsia endosymbiont of Ixodes persulcatus]|nr:LssY C-terminal domain-containing protein [Rickettsia endosymbiont of Ixodes persulcatus]
IWLLSVGIKWLLVAVNHWLRTYLNKTWTAALEGKIRGRYIALLTPIHESNHYGTALLVILLVLCLASIPLLLYGSFHSAWIQLINESIYQFCLTIRTQAFDAFFIVVRLDISTLALLTLCVTIFCYTLFHRDWRLLKYWLSLVVISSGLSHFLALTLNNPTVSPHHIKTTLTIFPAKELTFATGLFSFLMFYLSLYYTQMITIILRFLLLTALILSGIALIYLGEEWFSNVIIAYLIGFTNSLVHWIFYRREGKPHYRSYLPITLSVLLLLLATGLASLLFFEEIAETQQSFVKQYAIEQSVWWNQQAPVLPLYSTNRFGKKIALLNLQYVGPIQTLQTTLEQGGWKKQRDSFFYSLLLRVGKQHTTAMLPLMAQLYMNKKPDLIMTHGSAKDPNNLIIRLWRSNYHVNNHNQIIWIGSLQKQTMRSKLPSPESL